jgi:hypothetical protein
VRQLARLRRKITSELLTVNSTVSDEEITQMSQSYLEVHKALRVSLLSTCFLLASVCLFIAGTYRFGVAGGRPLNGWDVLLPVLAFLTALTCSLGMSLMLTKLGRREFWSKFVIVLIAVLVGAIATSVVVWREHWFELAREFLRIGG